MSDHSQISDRMLDLLIRRSTEGLSQQETAELHQAIVHSANRETLLREIDQIDFTAAAIGLTDPGTLPNDSNPTLPLNADEQLPAALRDSLLLDAGNFFAREQNTPKGKQESAGQKAEPAKVNLASPLSMREGLALLAAAASIMLLLSGYNPFATAPGETVADNPNGTQVVDADLDPKPLSLADQFDDFVDSKHADLIRVDWQPNSDKDAAGEVVWSDSLEKGFMSFTGLNINDPKISQYQLWIFDTNTAQAFPVDGGVFDIETIKDRTVVEIDARIPVNKAVLFAVTVEKPGGVVVSGRKNIPVLAAVPPGP